MNESERWDKYYQAAGGKAVWGGTRETFFDEIIKKYNLNGGILLDIGCGVGDKSLYFAKHGYQTIGVDISPIAVSEANRKAEEAKALSRFIVGDFRKIAEFPEIVKNSYDVALDLLSSQFLIGEEKARFSEQIARLIKPGGYYFFETFAKTNPKDELLGVEEWIRGIAVSPDEVHGLYGAYFEILEKIEKKSGNREGAIVHFYVMRRK